MKTLPSIPVANGPTLSWLRRSFLSFAILIASFQLLHAEDRSVANVQEALKAQSFYFGEVTGNFDESTRAGLRRFQIRHGLTASGEMDGATMATLNAGLPASAKLRTPVGALNPGAQPADQSDREFLQQVESGKNPAAPKEGVNTTAQSPAPAAQNAGEQRQGLPPEQAAQNKLPSVSSAPDQNAVGNVASTEPVAEPPENPKAKPDRDVEGRHAKGSADKHHELRSQKVEPEPVEDDPLDSTGVRVRTFSNPPRERPIAKSPENSTEKPVESPATASPASPSGTPLPRGSTVTTVTTRYMGSDGRIYIQKKTTTTIPRKPEPLFHEPLFHEPLFHSNRSGD